MIDQALAQSPPMGWNSFDAFGSSVTESQMIDNIDFVAENLKPFGWMYVVVDYCWSHPNPGAVTNPDVSFDSEGSSVPPLSMDEYGRLVPAVERFPSAAGGAGFAPLARYAHDRGLKFGLHVMRGIPREAVHRDLPIHGSSLRASAVADRRSKCRWLNHMYGVNMAIPGAQRYYDSLFDLYAGWGVDFVKADDLTNLHIYPDLDPALNQYAEAEIEALSRALSGCGRPMIFSVSVGPTPIDRAGHVAQNAHMWRVSADFWDRWTDLLEMFYYLRAWTPYRSSGGWPDADMIPFGRLSKCGPSGPERDSRFSDDEKTTLFTLWSIARSPLMLGGNLPEYDDHSLRLITNPDVIAVNQESSNNCELYNDGESVVWGAELPLGRQCVAVFNLGDDSREVPLSLSGLEAVPETGVDLWTGEQLRGLSNTYTVTVAPHGARLIALDVTHSDRMRRSMPPSGDTAWPPA